jgi:hypothetical protein
MRQRFCQELKELERIEAAAWQARVCRRGPSGREVFGELLTRHAIEQQIGESPAETVARAAGISGRELKDLLWERANPVGR